MQSNLPKKKVKFFLSCLALQLFAMAGIFLLGRYFGGKSIEPVTKYDIGIQKNESIVSQSLHLAASHSGLHAD